MEAVMFYSDTYPTMQEFKSWLSSLGQLQRIISSFGSPLGFAEAPLRHCTQLLQLTLAFFLFFPPCYSQESSLITSLCTLSLPVSGPSLWQNRGDQGAVGQGSSSIIKFCKSLDLFGSTCFYSPMHIKRCLIFSSQKEFQNLTFCTMSSTNFWQTVIYLPSTLFGPGSWGSREVMETFSLLFPFPRPLSGFPRSDFRRFGI